MNQFLVFGLLLIATLANSSKLESICEKDVFTYEKAYINSFMRISQNVPTPKIGFYAMDQSLSFSDFHNKTTDAELNRMKTYHNKQIIQKLYSDFFINGKDFNNIFSEYYAMKQQLQRIKYIKSDLNETKAAMVQSKMIDYMERSLGWAEYLLAFRNNKFAQIEGGLEWFIKIMSHVEIEDPENHIMSFQNDQISEVYEIREIVDRPKFVLHRASKLFYHPNTSGEMQFDIVLPFNDRNWDRLSKCTKATDLPMFYQNKPSE